MQICKRCVYNENIPKITFDAYGVCSYCHLHDSLNREYPTGAEGKETLEKIFDQIRKDGKGKPYDCVVGVSGGCDSSYLLYLAKSMGLRPLAAHFDNTWNSKIAVENIQALLSQLDVDLYTHVVSSKEYNDIFKSFFKASVPEIDTPADIGLATTHYLAAEKYNIKYILEGHSFRTEGISPPGWFYMDAKYIQGIQEKFGSMPIKTFPNLWFSRWICWMILRRIKKIRPLYFVDYSKQETKKFLSDNMGWQWYGGHHMENRTSYFANNYYLPLKFKLDLRYCEFSALIRTNQMSRDEALDQLSKPKEFDPGILEEIKKRLGFSDSEFEAIMALPPKSYRDYQTYKQMFETLRPFFWMLYKANMVPKSFYLKFACK